ncbi:MAG: hypothetical protein HZC14_03360 [Candidatus Niyogibacteria bacterium]|nr:hypothetical protein [Candidatus Niyogibacteria bacterium]
MSEKPPITPINTEPTEKSAEHQEAVAEKLELEKQSESKEGLKIEERLELERSLEKAADTQGQKIEAEIAAKESWIRNHIEQAADWYKKQPLKYKVLVSLGFVGAASLSAAMGGAVGTAIATAAFTGSMGQRMLGGLATFVTVEGLLKKAAEKGGRERSIWEARRHTMEAAVAGILVGTGSLSVAMKNIFGTISVEDAKEVTNGMKTLGVEKTVDQGDVSVAGTKQVIAGIGGAEEVIKPGDYAEVAQKGDSVWAMAKHQLARQYGEKFTGLDEARKTYLIDAVKDKIADNPHSFGLTDPDKLMVGQRVDFSSVFENHDDMARVFQGVKTLNESDIQNILDNNSAIREWAEAHTSEPLTSVKVEEIVSGRHWLAEEVGDMSGVGSGLPDAEAILPGAELDLPDVESVDSPPPMTDAVLDKMVRDDIFHDQVHDIYRHSLKGFSGQTLAEWNAVKGKLAFDILTADGPQDQSFGDAVRGGIDVELNDRTQMHNYIAQLTRESRLLPEKYESVENFIKKAIDRMVSMGKTPQLPSPSTKWLSFGWYGAT